MKEITISMRPFISFILAIFCLSTSAQLNKEILRLEFEAYKSESTNYQNELRLKQLQMLKDSFLFNRASSVFAQEPKEESEYYYEIQKQRMLLSLINENYEEGIRIYVESTKTEFIRHLGAILYLSADNWEMAKRSSTNQYYNDSIEVYHEQLREIWNKDERNYRLSLALPGSGQWLAGHSDDAIKSISLNLLANAGFFFLITKQMYFTSIITGLRFVNDFREGGALHAYSLTERKYEQRKFYKIQRLRRLILNELKSENCFSE